MNDLSEFCAQGAIFKEEIVSVSDDVSLRVISFKPPVLKKNPVIIFVTGWVSLITGWQKVLLEMTKDFTVHYIETREKISSQIKGKVRFGVEDIGRDITSLLSTLNLKSQEYILFGSSLGATAILDCCRFLGRQPLCLVLIGPNAVFRIPRFAKVIIRTFPVQLYQILKPVMKWYFRTFRLDVESDYEQYQKYCNVMDAADPRKLKKAAISLGKYQVWDLLDDIEIPTLIFGASKDMLHEPENLKKMVSMMKNVTYVDLETNTGTHSKGMVEEMRRYLRKLYFF